LVREDECVAAKLLEQLGVDLGSVRVEVMNHISRGTDRLGEDMQLTSEAKHIVDLAFDECSRMKDDWVGTEHLLAGLLAESEGLASGVLGKMGVILENLRVQICNMRAGLLPFEPVNENAKSYHAMSVI
jgi:ATP-dependent Clp protease ATP-binding subunit ClpC